MASTVTTAQAFRLDEGAILAVLDAFAADAVLFESYALKGGTALRLAYRTPRASVDVDLTSIEPHPDQPAAEGEAALLAFCERLDGALARVAPRHGFTDLYVQSRALIPPKKDPRTFPSFRVRVGYTRGGDRGRPYLETVGIDVTLNDVVCSSEVVPVGPIALHVSSLNDIVAEKLRALLQQVPRDRNRPGDVYDLWFVTTRARRLIDPRAIAGYLVEKSRDREGLGRVTADSFRHPEVRARAEVGYAAIADRLPLGQSLPAFSSAFDRVLAFVDTLPLP